VTPAEKALEAARDALEAMAEPCHDRDGNAFCDWCKLPFDRCNSRYPVCAGGISREAVANIDALLGPRGTWVTGVPSRGGRP